MTSDTIFRIYSMTKPITSVAVMMLYEEGHFFLSDPVGKYLPELADLEALHVEVDPETGEQTSERRPTTRPMTIRDLLRHTAGLTDGVFGNTEVDQAYRNAGIRFADRDLDEFVSKLGQIPLQYEPGTKWNYSVAIDVLGRLVEVVSGMPSNRLRVRPRLRRRLRPWERSASTTEVEPRARASGSTPKRS